MAATPSTMVSLGTPAPAFHLPDTVSRKSLSLKDLQGVNGTLIMFICNHCPYVKHLNSAIIALAKAYQPRGIHFVAISSNDAGQYPEDGPEEMAVTAKALGYPFPYLYDESQEVARAYDAACTPDFFLYDSDQKLYYRGQFDDARPKNEIPVTGKDLRAAFESLIGKQPAPAIQIPSIGCNIKWRA
ncbi:MAG: thioredoxin family protein [Bacteroidia bacterium]|nr:thioredoxin family protein [Bacteroidia bacterium]